MIRNLLPLALATTASANPLFEDRSGGLPAHQYTGGWEHFVGGGVAVFDCNGDTLPDMFAAGGADPAALLINEGDFTFRKSPLAEITGVTGAYPIEINNDGLIDLFVMRVGPNAVLFGEGDCTFADVTDDGRWPQDDRWTTAFTAWWEPGADAPTFAIGNYVDRTDPDGPFEACDDNFIWRPHLRQTRPQNTELPVVNQWTEWRAEPLTPSFCPLSMLAADDARGRPTLRISNDRHYYVAGGYEQMWDITDQRFLGPDDGWENLSLWGMGIASRDLDGDTRDEVMMTSMGDQLLQLARPDGTYINAPFEIGATAHRPYTGGDGRPSTGWHAQFGDVDNDGRADLFIAKGNVDQMPGMATRDPNNLLMQQADHSFVEYGEAAGIANFARARGAALADFDNDGRLDLVVMNRRANMELYRNVTPDAGQWIAVTLRQEGGNRNAVGAVITVNGQSQQNTVGGGHAGGQALPLHFGLGDAAVAEVTVTWPDGSSSSLTTEAGQIIDIIKSP